MDSVEKSEAYWDKDYQHAQVVREAKSKAEERKQNSRVCRMADKAIDSLFDNSVVLPDRHIHSEFMLQGKDGKPTHTQSTDDEKNTGNWQKAGSMFKVSDSLKTDKDANGYGSKNSDPQFGK